MLKINFEKILGFVALGVVGIGIVVALFSNIKFEDEPARSSFIDTTTFTTSSQIGTSTVSTTTTL